MVLVFAQIFIGPAKGLADKRAQLELGQGESLSLLGSGKERR